MDNKKHILFIIICSLFSLQLTAQVDIGIVHIEAMDSAIMDDELPVTFYVKNYSSEAFDQDLDIRFNILDEFPDVFDNDDYLEEEDYEELFIAAGDSVQLSKNVDLEDEDINAIVNDIIIIWPDRESINDTMPDNDIAYITIFEDETTNIDAFANIESLVKINISVSELIIQAKEHQIENLVLFSFSGSIVSSSKINAHIGRLNVSELNTGIFLLEIRLDNNKRLIEKVLIKN